MMPRNFSENDRHGREKRITQKIVYINSDHAIASTLPFSELFISTCVFTAFETFKDGFDIDLGSSFIRNFVLCALKTIVSVVYIQINSIAFEIDEISPHTSVEQAALKKAINC